MWDSAGWWCTAMAGSSGPGAGVGVEQMFAAYVSAPRSGQEHDERACLVSGPMAGAVSIRRATAGDRSTSVDTAARAFAADPFIRYLMPDDERY